MLGELEKKQKELMLIYDIIDEKEKRIKDFNLIGSKQQSTQSSIYNSKKEPENSTNEQHKKTKEQVLKLHEEGYTIEDIAKTLNIGKGEVKLLIQFSKSFQ